MLEGEARTLRGPSPESEPGQGTGAFLRGARPCRVQLAVAAPRDSRTSSLDGRAHTAGSLVTPVVCSAADLRKCDLSCWQRA
jgi:hypothetical protein